MGARYGKTDKRIDQMEREVRHLLRCAELIADWSSFPSDKDPAVLLLKARADRLAGSIGKLKDREGVR